MEVFPRSSLVPVRVHRISRMLVPHVFATDLYIRGTILPRSPPINLGKNCPKNLGNKSRGRVKVNDQVRYVLGMLYIYICVKNKIIFTISLSEQEDIYKRGKFFQKGY